MICFTAIAFQFASAHPTESVIHHYLLFLWRIKGYWSVGFVLLGEQTLPLNRQTWACSKHFVNAEGRQLYSDEIPSLTLPSNNRSLGNNWKKPRRYWLASLGDKPVTCTSLRSLHGLSRVANFPFSLGQNPPTLRLKSPGEVGVLVETISGTSEETLVDVWTLTKFHCWLYQATTKAWETTEESLEDIDLQVWAMSLSQLSLLYGSLVA